MAERDDLWLAWLTGEPSGRESAERLRAALAADPAWRAEMLADLRYHGALRGLVASDGADFAAAVAKRLSAGRDASRFLRAVRGRLPRRGWSRRRGQAGSRGRWALAAAALLMIAVGGWWAWPPTGDLPELNGVVLAIGADLEPRAASELRWRDGTTATLTAGSRLLVGDPADGKRLVLERGGLTAQVTPQPTGRSLAIRTAHAEITVKGTRFALIAAPAITRLEVESGEVAMRCLGNGETGEVRAAQFAESTKQGLHQGNLAGKSAGMQTVLAPPTDGLGLWLRADLGVVVEGTGVASWRDQSAAGIVAAQTDPALRPTLVVDAAGGKPALRFDGVDDELVFAMPVNGLAAMTLVMVSANPQPPQMVSFGGEYAGLFWGEIRDFGTVWLSPHRDRMSSHFGRGFGTVHYDAQWYPCPTPAGREFSLNVAVRSPTREQLWRDGRKLFDQEGSFPPVGGCEDSATIGGSQGAPWVQQPWPRATGRTHLSLLTAEILVYRRALTPADLTALLDYCRERYRLTTTAAP